MSSPDQVIYFGQTDSRNRRVKFGIKEKDRSRHMYVIGKTGMGKSTLLENMAVQDIQNGEGMAFIDPHGKTAELLLEYIPEERIDDVLYFAPFDMEYPIAFNVMEDIGPDKRHLVVAGLMSAFKKIWVDAWSARMEYILSNTLLALLEYPGATLLGINKMLADKEYRKKVVDNIKDPSVRSFWVDEFAKYTERFAAEATPAIQNKVGQFTSNPLIRNIVGQSKSTFDLRKMMDQKKIIIINLSKGRVGEGNANLLGSMLITKIYLAAMSRADVPEHQLAKLPNFHLYVDEFQSFANESFADILSEARKYKLALTVAHQYIEQMSEEVRAAVFGNVGTMITFRVGAYDAEVLEKEYAPQFTAEDLVNLGQFQMYLKLMIDGVSSPPFSATTLPPLEKPAIIHKAAAIEFSRKHFGHSRLEVEDNIKSLGKEEKVNPVDSKSNQISQNINSVNIPKPITNANLPESDNRDRKGERYEKHQPFKEQLNKINSTENKENIVNNKRPDNSPREKDRNFSNKSHFQNKPHQDNSNFQNNHQSKSVGQGGSKSLSELKMAIAAAVSANDNVPIKERKEENVPVINTVPKQAPVINSVPNMPVNRFQDIKTETPVKEKIEFKEEVPEEVLKEILDIKD